MKIPVKQDNKIEDGLHTGAIVDVEYRTEPYEYTDVVIETMVNGTGVRLKSGYSTYIAPSSKLGELLLRFKVPLIFGQEIDPKQVLTGLECQFQTITEKGKYAKIIPDSVKPVPNTKVYDGVHGANK